MCRQLCTRIYSLFMCTCDLHTNTSHMLRDSGLHYRCIYVSKQYIHLHSCMYASIYVKMYVCMKLCMCVCNYLCMYVCMHNMQTLQIPSTSATVQIGTLPSRGIEDPAMGREKRTSGAKGGEAVKVRVTWTVGKERERRGWILGTLTTCPEEGVCVGAHENTQNPAYSRPLLLVCTRNQCTTIS
jgi:hypothetical protein